MDLLSDGREDGWGVGRLPTEIVDVPVWKLLDLSGRTAIVTGGGGGGLGQACAKRLAAQGANIAIVDMDRSGAERVAVDVAEAYDVKTVGIEANLDDYSAAVHAVRMCQEQLGPVEILVNNVGGASQSVPFHDEEVPAIDAAIDKNLRPMLYMSHACLQTMVGRDFGRIVSIASEGGKVGMPGLATYNACKAAIIGWTRNVVFDIVGKNIRVNAVCPGIMLSNGMVELMQHAGHNELTTMGHSFRRVPLQRGALPEEVANLVVFLASDAASYVQGSAYSIGGGMEA